MPKHEAKIGLVSIKLGRNQRWIVRWWDARQKKYFQRVMPATSFAEAKSMAEVYNRELASQRGFIPSMRSKSGHSVNVALEESIGNTRALKKVKRGYSKLANQFLKWLREHRPGLTLWNELNAKTVGDFMRFSDAQGLSFDTCVARLRVIKATSKYMSEAYSDRYRNFARVVKLRRPKNTARLREERPLLSAGEVRDLIDFAAKSRPDLVGIITAQALAGLRILEASNLRECDVNFTEGTITVTETSRHAPKTISSDRTIPVAPEVLSALRKTIVAQRIKHPEGFIFLTRFHRPWGDDGVSTALRRLLAGACRETGHEALRGLIPRRLRAVFVNLLQGQRADHRAVQKYIGHAGTDTLSIHYQQATADWLRAEVVTRIDLAMKAAATPSEQAKSDERIADDLD